jgi:hypothetical protein
MCELFKNIGLGLFMATMIHFQKKKYLMDGETIVSLATLILVAFSTYLLIKEKRGG